MSGKVQYRDKTAELAFLCDLCGQKELLLCVLRSLQQVPSS